MGLLRWFFCEPVTMNPFTWDGKKPFFIQKPKPFLPPPTPAPPPPAPQVVYVDRTPPPRQETAIEKINREVTETIYGIDGFSFLSPAQQHELKEAAIRLAYQKLHDRIEEAT